MSTPQNHIILYSQHEFLKVQNFLIETIESKLSLGRILIIIRNKTPSLLLNVKATLWYFNGFSYPHLNSDDNMADAANIVVTQDIKYCTNKTNFSSIICIYSELTYAEVATMKNAKFIYVVDVDKSIKILSEGLLNHKTLFKTYQPQTIENTYTDKNKPESEASQHKSLNNYGNDNYGNPISDNISKNNYTSMNKGYTEYQDFDKGYDRQNPFEKAIVLIKPSVLKRKLEFILLFKLSESQALVSRYYRRKLPKDFWVQFYSNINDKEFFNAYCDYMAADYVGIANVYGKDCISKLRNLIGPTNPADCKTYQLRYQFGLDLMDNGIHVSDSIESYNRENNLLMATKQTSPY